MNIYYIFRKENHLISLIKKKFCIFLKFTVSIIEPGFKYNIQYDCVGGYLQNISVFNIETDKAAGTTYSVK